MQKFIEVFVFTVIIVWTLVILEHRLNLLCYRNILC